MPSASIAGVTDEAGMPDAPSPLGGPEGGVSGRPAEGPGPLGPGEGLVGAGAGPPGTVSLGPRQG